MKVVHISECSKCKRVFRVARVDDNFSYCYCPECREVNQINKYKTFRISQDNLKDIPIANIATVNIVKEEIQLVEITELDSVVEHFPYLNELYQVGDELVISDLLHKHKLVEFDNQRDMFKLFFIKHRYINLGIIGMETYSCDPTNAWLAWTTVIPRFRSKGYGKVAFNHLLNKLKLEGKYYLYVDSVPTEDATSFYRSLGFELISNCKKFRKQHGYNKEILSFNKNLVFRLKL